MKRIMSKRIGQALLMAMLLLTTVAGMAYADTGHRVVFAVETSGEDGMSDAGTITISTKNPVEIKLPGSAAKTYRQKTPDVIARVLVDQLAEANGWDNETRAMVESGLIHVGNNGYDRDMPGSYEFRYTEQDSAKSMVVDVVIWEETVFAQDFTVMEDEVSSLRMEDYITLGDVVARYFDGDLQEGVPSEIVDVNDAKVLPEAGAYIVTYETARGSIASCRVTVLHADAYVDLPDDTVPLAGEEMPEGIMPLEMELEPEPEPESEPEPEQQPEPEPQLEPATEPEPQPAREPEEVATEPIYIEEPIQEQPGNDDTEETDEDTGAAIPEQYTVRFVDGNGETYLSLTILSDVPLERPASEPVMEGMIFRHWHDVRVDETVPFIFDDFVKEDLTLVAYFVQEDALESDEDPTEEMEEASVEDTAEETEEETAAIIGEGGDEDGQIEEPIELNEGDTLLEEETERPTEDEPEEVIPPSATIGYEYEGEFIMGTVLTLYADLHNVPEGMALGFQWQNDASGTFEDVPGATEATYSFVADATNSGCGWRLLLSVPGQE